MQLFFEFPVTPDYSFKSFIACNGNNAALGFVRKVMSSDSAENLLFIYGDSGSGKTHLLSAVSRELSETAPPLPLHIIPVELINPENCEEIIRLVSSQPILLLDNLHRLQDSSTLRTAIWQLFNDFYESGRKIIASAIILRPLS